MVTVFNFNLGFSSSYLFLDWVWCIPWNFLPYTTSWRSQTLVGSGDMFLTYCIPARPFALDLCCILLAEPAIIVLPLVTCRRMCLKSSGVFHAIKWFSRTTLLPSSFVCFCQGHIDNFRSFALRRLYCVWSTRSGIEGRSLWKFLIAGSKEGWNNRTDDSKKMPGYRWATSFRFRWGIRRRWIEWCVWSLPTMVAETMSLLLDSWRSGRQRTVTECLWLMDRLRQLDHNY